MAVLMTLRLQGDPDRIEQALTSDTARLQGVADRAKQKGAIRHRVFAHAAGGEVLVVDEWDTAENFQQFFAETSEIGEMMAEAGVTGQPEPQFWRVLDTPDQF